MKTVFPEPYFKQKAVDFVSNVSRHMTYTNYDNLIFDVAIVNKKLKVCLYFRTLFQVWGFNFGTFYKEKNILLNSLAKTKHEAAELKFLETVAVIFIVMPFINARSSLKHKQVQYWVGKIFLRV